MSNYFLDISEYEDFLSVLGERLALYGASYDIVVAGGFAINRFYHGNRNLTHDLDFQFIRPVDSEEDSLLLNLVAEIAREYDLSPDWFNANLTDADIAERRNKYQRYFGERL
jgi:hypothetical protein